LFLFLAVSGALVLFWFVLSAFGLLGQTQPLSISFAVVAFLFISLSFSMVLASRSLRRATAPLDEMIEAARHVAEGEYTARVAERGPREVRTLARAFNTMSARLQSNDEQRRQLMADVAHELRTPLTVMQGNLEAMLDGIHPRDDAHLASLLDETRVLSRLVDDLRTLALSESGALQLQREPTDLNALVRDVLASFRAQADEAGVTLVAALAKDVPTLDLDQTRMREVLGNLLTNALRYTPRGGSVRVQSALEGEQQVAVRVSDTGAGIAPEDVPHIFERFYRARDSHGSGLGLTISKHLVEAHGGSIAADSAVAQGTIITLTLPFHQQG
ncbi:MAG: HAMP domain-containing protein, partial [Chloroflexi bacterium]|nr:HAMP domain-containing protein [Chloroflexota bacterium]